LNVLRTCDIPEAAGMLAPRSITVRGASPTWIKKVTAIYQLAGAAEQFTASNAADK
jgi:hypothetical protein